MNKVDIFNRYVFSILLQHALIVIKFAYLIDVILLKFILLSAHIKRLIIRQISLFISE